MKKIIALALCAVMLIVAVPSMAFADSQYSTASNLDVALEYPAPNEYYTLPLLATVKATKPNGSIYFMPVPEAGNGVLGTVANGTEVTILAEKSGYYFFTTADGRKGWNGKKFFVVTGTASTVPAAADSKVFYFDSGACVTLPSGFYSSSVDRDRNNAYIDSFFTNFSQNMDLTLTEINTYMYYQRDSDFMNSLYSSLKEDYPTPTYDLKKANLFALSGYTGNSIYYFYAVLSDQVIYLMKMFYPIKNRSICDRYVESITSSFVLPGSAPWGKPTPSSSTVKIPVNPSSPYAIALKDNLQNGISYTDWQKKDVINETYYGRKDAKGNRQDWYTSSAYDDPNTGYRIGFYYADGLVFFADAYYVGQRSAVTFYFWGDHLLCVHDTRNGDKQLHFAGSDTYNSVVSEFGNLYVKALQYAK